MMNGSVSGIGGNVHSTSFHGAALHSAKILGLSGSVFAEMLKQHDDLTSPFPTGVKDMIGAMVNKVIPGAEHATETRSQNVGSRQNTGPGVGH